MTDPAPRMTPAERVATVERILRPAIAVLADTESSPADVDRARGIWRQVGDLLDGLQAGREDPRSAPGTVRPHDAREAGNDSRQAAGLHPLRKGRDQCTATRRDGQPCQAPAIEGGLVCKRHGGAAPQVAIAAEYREKQDAAAGAALAFEEARGTPRELDALCRALRAQEELDEYEDKLARLKELRAELRRRRRDTGEKPREDRGPGSRAV